MTSNGATIPDWSGRRAQAALAHVRAEGRAKGSPCVLCGEPINYALHKPHPMACTVQHIKSRKHHPALTWDPSNWAPAHARCNSEAGEGHDPRAGKPLDVGVTSQTW